MAFDRKGLFRVSHLGSVGTGAGSVKSLHTFHTNDDAATVETAGYFNDQVKQFALGDIILAVLDLDGTMVMKSYVVSALTATVVTITVGTM